MIQRIQVNAIETPDGCLVGPALRLGLPHHAHLRDPIT